MGIDAWGNAYHGKVIGADVQLPNATTYTLTNPPNNGNTRLIQFAGLTAPFIPANIQSQLTAEGKSFETWAILSGDRLYDKTVGGDLWLYRASDTKVWKVIINDIAVSAGQADVTLDYSRFGEFKPDTPAPPPAVSGQITFTVFTSNAAEAGTHNYTLCDISPDGTKAIIQISYTATTTELAKINYIELTLSGVIDDSGAGLNGSGVELVDTATGLSLSTANNSVSYQTMDLYYTVTETLNEYPPPSTGPANGFIDYKFAKDVQFVLVPAGSSPPANAGPLLSTEGTIGYVTQNDYIYSFYDTFLYDKSNTRHSFRYDVDYTYSASGGASVMNTSGVATVEKTVRQYYDESGNASNARVISSGVTGSSEYTTSTLTVEDEQFNYKLYRDSGLVVDLQARRNPTVDVTTGGIIDDSSVLINDWVNVLGESISWNTSPSASSSISGTGKDFNGVTYSYPADSTSEPVLSHYTDHFEQMVDGQPSTDSTPDFYIPAASGQPQVISFKPTNNIMSVKLGIQLETNSPIINEIREIATPSGSDNTVYTGGQSLHYSFNPFTGELVRESASVVNFM